MALGIIGILIALAIFLYGAYRNLAPIYLAPICGVIVAVFNGINLVEAFSVLHIEGVTEMLIAVFPTIFLGAILGKIFQDSGAAASVTKMLNDKYVMKADDKEKRVKRAVLIILLITCVMTFGGIDGFVAVFAIFPIVMIMAETIGIPRRFVPAMLCLGAGANSAPGVPMINNIIVMQILGTSSMAAAIPGYITFVVIEVGIYFICTKMIISAMRKGEFFDPGDCGEVPCGGELNEGPSFVLSIIPLAVVFILFAFLRFSPSTSITAGIVLSIVLLYKYLPQRSQRGESLTTPGSIIETLNTGSTNGATALMTITAAAGFAGVVTHTETFGAFVGMLFNMPLAPLLTAIVLLVIIVAFTSSPPAALIVALPIIAGAFIWVEAPIINPNALARIAAIAVSTFETLPVNGLIILTTGIAHVKIKDAYKPMFFQTVVMTTIGTILCTVLIMLFPSLA